MPLQSVSSRLVCPRIRLVEWRNESKASSVLSRQTTGPSSEAPGMRPALGSDPCLTEHSRVKHLVLQSACIAPRARSHRRLEGKNTALLANVPPSPGLRVLTMSQQRPFGSPALSFRPIVASRLKCLPGSRCRIVAAGNAGPVPMPANTGSPRRLRTHGGDRGSIFPHPCSWSEFRS